MVQNLNTRNETIIVRVPQDRNDTVIQRVDRGETEIQRIAGNDDYQSDCSETDMIAAKVFKRAP